MKIAITSQGDNLDSLVDQRFGRCPYLILVETDAMQVEAVANPYADEGGGVGSRLAALVADRGVQEVLTGTVGPNARQALDAAGVGAMLDCKGTVREVLDAYQAGRLQPRPAAASPTSSNPAEPAGQGRGFGRGRGLGGGRQRRGGGGRGQGRGRGGKGCGEGRRQRRRRSESQ